MPKARRRLTARWPSGPAGGFVTRAHPEFRVHCLCSGDPSGRGDLVKRLGSFRVELDGAGGLVSYESCADGEGLAFSVCTPYPTGWENDGGYLDTMDSDAVDEYVRVTPSSKLFDAATRTSGSVGSIAIAGSF